MLHDDTGERVYFSLFFSFFILNYSIVTFIFHCSALHIIHGWISEANDEIMAKMSSSGANFTVRQIVENQVGRTHGPKVRLTTSRTAT